MAIRTQEIFDIKHRLDTRTLRVLRDAELDEVQRIAMDRNHANRTRALGILASAQHGDPATFARILTDREEPADIRAVAIRALSAWRRDAEPVLLEALRSADTAALRQHLLLALARVATSAAVRQVQRFTNDENEQVRIAAVYAQALIAARDQDDTLAPRINGGPLEADQLRGQSFSIERASLPVAAAVLAALENDSFGVNMERDLIYVVDCGREGRILVLDAAFSEPRRESTGTRPIALLTKRADEDGSYSIASVIISQATDAGMQLIAFRTDGRVWMLGRLNKDGRFESRTVHGQGNIAVSISGTFDGDEFHLEQSMAGRAIEKKTPHRIDRTTAQQQE